MKKFEDELKDKGVEIITHQPCCSLSRKVLLNYADVVNLSEDWVSPEEHQYVVEKLESLEDEFETLKLQLNNSAEELERLDALEKENESLKAQLEKQKPEIPEVPQFVADWLDRKPLYAINGPISVEVIEWAQKQTGYADLGTNINHLLKLKVNGYTVAKEKRFYLKNKLTNGYLTFYPVTGYYGHFRGDIEECLDLQTKFTQAEIDNMETGSYEIIDVEK